MKRVLGPVFVRITRSGRASTQWILAGFAVLASGLGLASAGALPLRTESKAQLDSSSVAPKPKGQPRPGTNASRTEPAQSTSPFAALPPLELVNLNTGKALSLRLYTADGQVDARAVEKLNELLLEAREPGYAAAPGVRIAERTLQLLYRAAYHFGAPRVEVVSAYRERRRRREGPHASGRAVDFKLIGTKAATLASYLRSLPRVGVGVYTHPKTQYVHLDVRDESFHWLDASPPGKNWRERSLGTRALKALDAAYVAGNDWPEGTQPPGLFTSIRNATSARPEPTTALP